MTEPVPGPDPGPDPGPGPKRAGFGPIVLTGLATSALVAVASAKPWYGLAGASGSTDATMTAIDRGTTYPAASATSLVLLAAWGVLLVTRGRVRRAFAVVAAVASLGVLAALVSAYVTLPDTAGVAYDGLMGRAASGDGFTGWFWTAAVVAVLAVPPTLLAVRHAPRWPEMGAQYDAPAGREHDAANRRGDATRDLWSEIDEGRDPTDPSR